MICLRPKSSLGLTLPSKQKEVSRTAAEIKSICRAHMPEAIERLIEIAATARNPKLRRKASAFLLSRLREAGLDVSRRSTEQPGDKPS
jgi:hypothetical protein